MDEPLDASGLEAKFRRARMLLDDALTEQEPNRRFDRLVAAVEQAVGIADQVWNSRKGRFPSIRIDEESLRRRLHGELPYYELLKRLRIHDFHRNGLTAEPGTQKFLGEVTISAEGSNQVVEHGLTLEGLPYSRKTPGGRVEIDRQMLYQRGDRFLDEETGQYITLDQALSAYLEKIPALIEWYRSMARRS